MTSPRLSPTATLVLAVLLEQPMHPYEMLVRLRKRRDDRLVRLNPGAVYHAVDRLERDGLVERAGVDRDGNRPERTLYAITPAGVAAHDARTRDLVRETPREYPAFPVGLALVHDLPREDALALLRERRARSRPRSTGCASASTTWSRAACPAATCSTPTSSSTRPGPRSPGSTRPSRTSRPAR